MTAFTLSDPFYQEALREVDALTPGSAPLAAPVKPTLPWWHAAAVCVSPASQLYVLIHDFGTGIAGQRVGLAWLEYNRSNQAIAVEET